MKTTEQATFVVMLTRLATSKQIKMLDGTHEVYWEVLRNMPMWAVRQAIEQEMASPNSAYGRLPDAGVILHGAKMIIYRREDAIKQGPLDAWRIALDAVNKHRDDDTFCIDHPACQAALRSAGFNGTLESVYLFNQRREEFISEYRRYLDRAPTAQEARPIKATYGAWVRTIASGLPQATELRQALTAGTEHGRAWARRPTCMSVTTP